MSPASSTSRPQKPFPFLSLPAELRNRIYKLRLCVGTCYVTDPPHTKLKRKRRKPDVAILRCSKQTYSEAITILYGENTIYLPWDLDEMEPLDLRAVDAIQYLEIKVPGSVVSRQQIEWFTDPYRRLKSVDFTVPDRFVFDFLTIPIWRQENPDNGQVPHITVDLEAGNGGSADWSTGVRAVEGVKYEYSSQHDHSRIFQHCGELAQIKLKTSTYLSRLGILEGFTLLGWAFKRVETKDFGPMGFGPQYSMRLIWVGETNETKG